MVKKSSRFKRSGHNELTLIGDQIMEYLEKLGGTEQRSRFARLWNTWHTLVPGTQVAGHRGEILILQAEDALESQELSMRATDILDAANSFMGERVFTRIRVEIGKNSGKNCP